MLRQRRLLLVFLVGLVSPFFVTSVRSQDEARWQDPDFDQCFMTSESLEMYYLDHGPVPDGLPENESPYAFKPRLPPVSRLPSIETILKHVPLWWYDSHALNHETGQQGAEIHRLPPDSRECSVPESHSWGICTGIFNATHNPAGATYRFPQGIHGKLSDVEAHIEDLIAHLELSLPIKRDVSREQAEWAAALSPEQGEAGWQAVEAKSKELRVSSTDDEGAYQCYRAYRDLMCSQYLTPCISCLTPGGGGFSLDGLSTGLSVQSMNFTVPPCSSVCTRVEDVCAARLPSTFVRCSGPRDIESDTMLPNQLALYRSALQTPWHDLSSESLHPIMATWEDDTGLDSKLYCVGATPRTAGVSALLPSLGMAVLGSLLVLIVQASGLTIKISEPF